MSDQGIGTFRTLTNIYHGTIFTKRSIIHVTQGPKSAYEMYNVFHAQRE